MEQYAKIGDCMDNKKEPYLPEGCERPSTSSQKPATEKEERNCTPAFWPRGYNISMGALCWEPTTRVCIGKACLLLPAVACVHEGELAL
eukprot:4959108-Pyramimonas_sp.AAC.1